MIKSISIILLALLPLLCFGKGPSDVVLLGQEKDIAFDDVKAGYISNTVNALLQSSTVKTRVEAIPPVTYKGVRLTQGNKVIEAHIFPDSRNSYMVKIYTRENGIVLLYGKYTNHAYQLISMLEMKPLK
jgi:hypothetical protein